MPTNRELYFQSLKIENKYLNKNVIRSLLVKANSFDNDMDLTLNFDKDIDDYQCFSDLLNRVLSGEPYQYVINESIFLGHKYYVNDNVLIPRQETEQLVLETIDLINSHFNDKKISIADVCTGSGIIANELSLKYADSNVIGTDISSDALKVAIRNSVILDTNINFYCGDMLTPLIDRDIKIDVLVCNPPYIENKNTIDEQTWNYEPHLALLANPSTYFYEEIFKNYRLIMNSKFIMSFEIEEDMQEPLTKLINKYFENVCFEFRKDLYNKTRFLYIIKNMDKDIKKAGEILKNGGIVSFPTETVMGLGVIYDNFDSYSRLNKVKERPEDKPYSLMIANTDDIETFAYIDERSKKLINKFLPGPVTLLLPVKNTVPTWVSHNGPTVGIRVPSHQTCHELLLAVEKPLLVPSANKSGNKPAMTAQEVYNEFGNSIDFIVQENAEGGTPSTIIDLTGEDIKIVRQGPITMDMIIKALEE